MKDDGSVFDLDGWVYELLFAELKRRKDQIWWERAWGKCEFS